MSKESFEECMKRLFTSINPNANWKSVNRLDLFEILFNDRQEKIDELKDINEEIGRANYGFAQRVDELKKQNQELVDALELISTEDTDGHEYKNLYETVVIIAREALAKVKGEE